MVTRYPCDFQMSWKERPNTQLFRNLCNRPAGHRADFDPQDPYGEQPHINVCGFHRRIMVRGGWLLTPLRFSS